ncbi:MAG TPA: DoxX family protein [Dongiaceae bacterium]|nr:DoxX family protein [Dongiaceae bacterium]
MASLAQTIPASRAQASSTAPVVFLGRLFFVLIFLLAGLNHFSKPTIAFAASQGVPAAPLLVPASGILAILGGLSILLGYRAKLGAWLIVIFLIGVTPLHKFWGISDPMVQQLQMALFMKNISMLGAALLITQFGSGPWSLDARK